jgi:hypothetical protein
MFLLCAGLNLITSSQAHCFICRKYRGQSLIESPPVEASELEELLSVRLPREALREAGVSAACVSYSPNLQLEDRARATVTFDARSFPHPAKEDQLDMLIESAWSILQDELCPPEDGLILCASGSCLSVGGGRVSACQQSIRAVGLQGSLGPQRL